MTNAVATMPQTQLTASDKYDQADVIAAIKQTVCKGASDAQLKMFIEVCRTTGLNPWLREIWFVAEKSIIMAGRDGYLRVANEHPQFDGIETRVERDEKNVPIKAVCTVWRKDRNHPTVCEAYYSEYRKGSPVWTTYPSAMISKVAEVLALKRSFAINGVVTEEEIGSQGDERGTKEAAQAVAERKLAAVKQEAPAVLDAEFIEDEPHPDPEMALHLEILAGMRKSTKPYDKFKMLPEIQKLKARFTALDREDVYYRVLNRCGVEKSNQLPSDDGGLMARVAYKELGMILQVIEPPAPKVPEVDKLPDAVEQVAGAVVRYQGADWIVVDSDQGHQWELRP